MYDTLALNEVDIKQQEAWRTITLAMLLEHRAGFDRSRSGDPMLQHPPCPYDIGRLSAVQLDFTPGSAFAYSNLGYCLAGLILERATARSLLDLYRSHIFEPLELDIASITQRSDLEALDSALRPAATELAALESWNWQALAAAGSLAGTARDMGQVLYSLHREGSPLATAGRSLLMPLSSCDESLWRTCHGLAFYSYKKPGAKRMF